VYKLFEARSISAAENLQREDLSAIETIEAIVEIVDAELIEDKEYALMGNKPANRVKILLGKFHSTTSSKNRGSKVLKKGNLLLSTCTQQLEEIFKTLLKSLEWRSFYRYDLRIPMDIYQDVRKLVIQKEILTEPKRSP